jgi:Fe2+ transport system protein FeoA
MNANLEHLETSTDGCTNAALAPLRQVKPGRTVRIGALRASPEISCKLREIGLCEGQLVRLITNSANVICQVCNARLALNGRLAQMIMVELLGD